MFYKLKKVFLNRPSLLPENFISPEGQQAIKKRERESSLGQVTTE
jgi:hypothetical protein